MSEDTRKEESYGERQPPGRVKKRRKPSPAVPVPQESAGRKRPGKKQNSALDSDACMAALSQLPGLIAMGLLTTGQANSIRGVYNVILQQHDRARTGRDQAQLDDGDVMALLRENPGMLNMLAPLLTEAQVAAIMEDSEESQDG